MTTGSKLLVQCSHCGKCCEETEMELSSSDMERLEKAGYRRNEFTVTHDSVTRLRNINRTCYFYNPTDKKCRVYRKRPLGCQLYPVVHLANEGATIDELCPMGHTISKQELRTKAKTLIKLLKNIDNERAHATINHQRKPAQRNQNKPKKANQKKMGQS
jgi:Fe-S-cluster containining protein